MKLLTLMEDTAGEAAVKGEHGLSFYIETEQHRLLMDTGASDLTWENAEKLGVDLESIDTVIISHGHYDHAGGLLGFARKNPDAQIYMQASAGGDYFHRDRYIGIDKEILRLPQLHLLEGDYRIDEELQLFSGILGRRLWPESNLALSEKIDNARVQDQFLHEQCLVVCSGDTKILLSGCAHNGILNILSRFESIYHAYPDVVISGFHMMKKTDYTEAESNNIKETAHELKLLPTHFYTGHCTGQKAFDLMKQILGQQLHQIHAGDVLSQSDKTPTSASGE